MSPLTTYETWYGRNEPPPRIEKLRAGALTMEFEQGDLRYLCFGNLELIRRVYVAIRDVNWNTIPAQISDMHIDEKEDRFHITYQAFHQDRDLRFRWQADLRGDPDGTVELRMDGVAESDFRYNRIGFCVLHPIPGIAGRPYEAITPAGPVKGSLPERVEPQRMVNGFEVPIFPSCSSLAIDLESGIRLTTIFEGDLFEMEDQRNWTDGSFKTYCTPISLGYPYPAKSGQAFHQKVAIQVDVPAGQAGQERGEPAADKPGAAIRFTLGDPAGHPLPKIGFGIPAAGPEPGQEQIALLSQLRPDHLRTDIHLDDPAWPAVLERAVKVARQVGSPLELALFLTGDSPDALDRLKANLAGVTVARVIVFGEQEAASETTRAKWMQMARANLSGALPGARFVGGTNGNFAELNRDRPDTAIMEGVSYTLNPQVHASDERSLVEALEGQHDSVLSARSFSGSLPVSVSPVTLKPPFNQAAKEQEGPADPNQLPASVDPRQMSLFGAAWTVGSLNALASAGAGSLTCYETWGWRGLMETPAGSPLPEKFHSFPGMIFPLYHVFAFLTQARAGGAALLESRSDRPLLVGGLALQDSRNLWLLLANYQPAGQAVRVCSLPEGEARRIRIHENTAPLLTAPDASLPAGEPAAYQNGELSLTLMPYETSLIHITR